MARISVCQLTSLVLLRCGRTVGSPNHNTSAAASAATGVSERPSRTKRHSRRAAAHPPPTRPAAHAPLANPVPGTGPQPPRPDRHATPTPRACNTPAGGAATDTAEHPAHALRGLDHAPPTPSRSATARGMNDPAGPGDSLTNMVLLRSGQPTALLLTILRPLRQQQPALEGTARVAAPYSAIGMVQVCLADTASAEAPSLAHPQTFDIQRGFRGFDRPVGGHGFATRNLGSHQAGPTRYFPERESGRLGNSRATCRQSG